MIIKHLLSTLLLCFAVSASAQLFPETIKPLLKTAWSQREPFNMLCPKATNKQGDKQRQLAGCGPVAMAQVINYYQYPSKSPDGKYNYEWDKMCATYIKDYTTADQVLNVAKLINDCGVAAFTSYGLDRSGTQFPHTICALQRLFGYSRYMYIVTRDSIPSEQRDKDFAALIYSELKAGCPVLARGNKPGTKQGHMFIIDGCKGDKVHINMGWGEDQNGYFKLSDLGGYSEKASIIVGVASKDYVPKITTVNIESEGQLASKIKSLCENDPSFASITHMKVNGPLNKTDILTLRLMALLKKGVRSLDLSDAKMRIIPDSAFYGTPLVYVALPKDTKKISKSAFAKCRYLRQVDLPDSLITIDRYAFAANSSLLDIKFPATLQNIAKQAFCYCTSLLNVDVPKDMKLLDPTAFEGCKFYNKTIATKENE